jgi:hypothetical protein
MGDKQNRSVFYSCIQVRLQDMTIFFHNPVKPFMSHESAFDTQTLTQPWAVTGTRP